MPEKRSGTPWGSVSTPDIGVIIRFAEYFNKLLGTMPFSSRYRTVVGAVLVFCGFLLSAVRGDTQAQQETPEAPTPQPLQGGFWPRLATFYHQDWTNTAPQSPAPPRRGQSSPLQSPPFPSQDWSYGGSPVIGEPDGNSYPLMAAIDENRSRTKLYGWIDPSVNGSTSAHSNSPEANDLDSNRLELDQVVLYLE
jgi:hypothetical protein